MIGEGSLAEVVERRARWCLLEGESFKTLCSLPDACVDGLVTDPPYSSGGQYRGDRTQDTRAKYIQTGAKTLAPSFSGDARDQRAYFAWCVLWLSEALRASKPGAPACLFSDWRQLPVMTDALQAGGWVWRGIVPWDKLSGRPQKGRFRAQAEFVVWGTNGAMPVERGVGCLDGVFRYPPICAADRDHQTEKPIDLMIRVNEIVEPEGLILDPFAGSGTTIAAALRRGYRGLGIEQVPAIAEGARVRLRSEIPS